MLDIKVFIYGMLMHLQNNIAIHALLRIFQHPCYVYERLYVFLLLINRSLHNTKQYLCIIVHVLSTNSCMCVVYTHVDKCGIIERHTSETCPKRCNKRQRATDVDVIGNKSWTDCPDHMLAKFNKVSVSGTRILN